MVKLTSLSVEDSSHSGIKLSPGFDPSVLYYTVDGVHEDIVGIKLEAKAAAGVSIKIVSEIDTDTHVNGSGAAKRLPGADGPGTWPYGKDWPNLHFPEGTATVRTFRNPAPIGSGPTGIWNDNGAFRGPHSTNAYITASEGTEKTTYTITINVLDGAPSYNLFRIYAYGGKNNSGDGYTYAGPAYTSTIDDGAGGEKVKVNYLLYVPRDIDPNEKLPVIYSPHGKVQEEQPPDMTLKRYQLGTSWAKNSEARADRRAIVLVVHSTNWDFSHKPATRDYNEADKSAYASGHHKGSHLKLQGNASGYPEGSYLSLQGKASFELLTKLVKGEGPFIALAGKVDPGRIYVQGFSMGGACAVACLSEHPNYFAAALIGAPVTVFNSKTAATVAAGGTPIYSVHAYDDPVVDFHNSEINNDLLKAASIAYTPVDYTAATNESKLVTHYYSSGTYFYETAHFAAQVPLYFDESFFKWFFAQKRNADAAE
jgi:predicted esterase